ncbi:MAG: zinc-ribbon domain-containing protein [Lachnospiraceae bacterium]|nr:zinc-ribbon domain-containing protein [Lachnospiraceae bacterium]
MFCSECGNVIKEGVRFCSKCGHPVKMVAPGAQTPPPPPVNAGNQVPPPPPVNAGNQVPPPPPVPAQEEKTKIFMPGDKKPAYGDPDKTMMLMGSVPPPPPVNSGNQVPPPPPVNGGNQVPPPPPVNSGNQVPPPPQVNSGNQVPPPPPVNGGNRVAPPPQANGGQRPPKKGSALPFIIIAAVLLVAIIVVVVIFILPGSGSDGVDKEDNKKASKEKEEDVDKDKDKEEENKQPEPEPEPVRGDLTIYFEDSEGNNAEAVNVVLYNGATEIGSVVTAADGKATFKDLEEGTYSYLVTADKFANYTGEVTIDESFPGGSIHQPLERVAADVIVYVEATNEGYSARNVSISFIKGHDNAGGTPDVITASGETGWAKVPQLELGDYTVVFRADGMFEEVQNVTVNGDMNVEERMVPLPTEDSGALVLVEWDNQDLDLDICLFNSGDRVYVNNANGIDKRGNFLYADNNGLKGYELFQIRDINWNKAQTLYVLDSYTTSLGGTSSEMGKTVRCSIYTNDRVRTYTIPDGVDAVVWTPCYFQSGGPLDVGEFSNDPNSFDWVRDILGSK